jgi:hypothetical protein
MHSNLLANAVLKHLRFSMCSVSPNAASDFTYPWRLFVQGPHMETNRWRPEQEIPGGRSAMACVSRYLASSLPLRCPSLSLRSNLFLNTRLRTACFMFNEGAGNSVRLWLVLIADAALLIPILSLGFTLDNRDVFQERNPRGCWRSSVSFADFPCPTRKTKSFPNLALSMNIKYGPHKFSFCVTVKKLSLCVDREWVTLFC